ncbi:MAG: tlde1 domain-containing protein [Candidatus Sulfotelmatobacter sp.]
MKNINQAHPHRSIAPVSVDAQPTTATFQQKTARIDLEAFAWTYAQKSGELQQDGKPVATGYSGAGAGKNNPAMQNVPNIGPIPEGDWTIAGPPADTPDHGPYVLKVNPAAGTETFGRSGFLMHGDATEHPGCASHGCVILPRAVREQVWTSGDRELEVRAEIPASASEEGNGE